MARIYPASRQAAEQGSIECPEKSTQDLSVALVERGDSGIILSTRNGNDAVKVATTMFRRLYWVTEEVKQDTSSSVTGIFTSIPDLLRRGLESRNGQPSRFRLSLFKLDSTTGPLGTWEHPNFEGLEDKLQEFIKTDEFSADQCSMLVQELSKLAN